MKATRMITLAIFLCASVSLANGVFAAESEVYSDSSQTNINSATASDAFWGDDSSQWANDGECDDPRFAGPGAASLLRYDGLQADSSDCHALYLQGDLELREENSPEGIFWGDDSSRWANDGECDDPRFAGPGVADVVFWKRIGCAMPVIASGCFKECESCSSRQ